MTMKKYQVELKATKFKGKPKFETFQVETVETELETIVYDTVISEFDSTSKKLGLNPDRIKPRKIDHRAEQARRAKAYAVQMAANGSINYENMVDIKSSRSLGRAMTQSYRVIK